MGRRDRRHLGRGLLLWLPVVVVLAVLGAGVLVWQYADPSAPQQPESPAAVPPPPGLDLPAPASPAPVDAPVSGIGAVGGGSGGPTLDPARVRRAIAPVLEDKDLGRHVLATVAAPDGTLLYTRGMGTGTPASTAKLLTSTAALATLGPDHTFATTVVADGPRGIVLVGGGDPLLAGKPTEPDAYPQRADVVTLARATARALLARHHTRVRVGYDSGLFTGPDVNPHWPRSYVPDDVVPPIQALWVDEGRTAAGYDFVPDPARAAAAEFAAALARAGVRVDGAPQPRSAAKGAPELARVTSPPLWQVVEHTVLVSDNEAAEVLARHVGLERAGEGSFEAGSAAVLDVLHGLGVPTADAVLHDGSGLSRQDRLDPDTLTAVLALASSADHPELRSVVTGLPVAGFAGSLADHFATSDPAGLGVVRAKTGTLTGVRGLAGIVLDRTGHPMYFALLADRIRPLDTLDAEARLDDASSELAACRCAGR